MKENLTIRSFNDTIRHVVFIFLFSAAGLGLLSLPLSSMVINAKTSSNSTSDSTALATGPVVHKWGFV